MRKNQCDSCKYGKSMWRTYGLFSHWQEFYVVCEKLNNDEITPCLHDFIATCGCASFEEDKG
jgi:hypothetical protein